MDDNSLDLERDEDTVWRDPLEVLAEVPIGNPEEQDLVDKLPIRVHRVM